MQHIGRWVALGCLVGVLAGCGGDMMVSTAQPTVVAGAADAARQVDVRGTITGIDPPAGQNLLTLTIEGQQAPDTRYPSALVRVPDSTPIYRMDGTTKVDMTRDQLEVGQRVEIIFTGPVSRSLPPQATAAEIMVLP